MDSQSRVGKTSSGESSASTAPSFMLMALTGLWVSMIPYPKLNPVTDFEHRHFMLDSPTWTEVYAPRGELLVEGEFIQRLNYARTLEKIAKEGASSFYEGDIAQSSVKTIVGHGGVISMDDVSRY